MTLWPARRELSESPPIRTVRYAAQQKSRQQMIDGIDVRNKRSEFPSLAVTDDGRPRICSSTIPRARRMLQRVTDRITGYLARANANWGGPFVTSWDSDLIIDARRVLPWPPSWVCGASSDEVVFGPNMTSLTFQIARAAGAMDPDPATDHWSPAWITTAT